MRRRRATVMLAGIATSALLAGCGSDGGTGTPAAGGGAGAAPSAATASATPSSKASKAPKRRPVTSPPPAPTQRPGTGVPDSRRVSCPTPTRTVHTGAELTAALKAAQPGDTIALADGTYAGPFTATTPGTAARPIFLCGSTAAVLTGEKISKDYVLHVDHAGWWRLVGFSVTNGQKGVVVDGCRSCVVQGLSVHDIGDEGIHLRENTTDSLVLSNVVSRTGLHNAKFGEGIYVGSAVSNWCTYTDCNPDQSDRNVIRGNRISATTSESVDIKEGTTGGVLADNQFDGSGITAADSWVDVKGNGWLITGNTGQHTPQDGFQTHQVVNGWGTGNVFTHNTAAVGAAGYGFHLAPVAGNVVRCDNTVTGAGAGLANTPCTS